MLKIGNDHFEATHLEPKVDVCNRRYVFDAQPPPNSPYPLVFNPSAKCPAFVVNPKIARLALEKQRTDEVEYAQLLKDNVPAAPIYSGLDGGMNEVFLARFPVRVTLAKVLPYASYLPQLPPIPWVDKDGSLTSKLFGSLFRGEGDHFSIKQKDISEGSTAPGQREFSTVKEASANPP
jgi:hypothetical protein